MTRTDPLSTLRRRACQHSLEDGIADILVGLFTLFVGGATQNRRLIPLAVVYVLVYAIAWRFLHEKFSSRRIGYAELPDQPARLLLLGTFAAMVSTMIVVAAITWSSGALWNVGHWPTWSPALAGLVLAGGFLHTAVRSGLRRYYGFMVAALAGSVFFWQFPFGPRINPSDRLTLFFFALAAVLMLTGAAVLIRFTRTRPIAPEEALDGR